MDAATLARMDLEQLTNYVSARLRQEGPLDPRGQFLEPPESFLIQAVQENSDTEFRSRLILAIKQNIGSLQLSLVTGSQDSNFLEYIASLAYLATLIKAEELGETFYRLTSK